MPQRASRSIVSGALVTFLVGNFWVAEDGRLSFVGYSAMQILPDAAGVG